MMSYANNYSWETFGLPGVGKTTVINSLSGEIKIVKINSRTEKIRYFFVYCAKHPILFLYFYINIILYSRSFGSTSYLKLVWHKMTNLTPIILAKKAKQQIIIKKIKKPAVIEDGLLVLMLSTFDIDVPHSCVERYLQNSRIILLTVNSSTRKHRMQIRERFPRMDKFGDSYYQKYDYQLHKNYLRIVHYLHDNHCERMLKFNLLGDVNIIAKKIENILKGVFNFHV
jgi:hypothetical protein